MLEQGQTVGPYELVRELGSGTFGVVWLARHVDWGEECALKIPTDPHYVAQLRKEGKIMRAAPHPNIVQTVAMNTLHEPPYFAMEYVEGENLRARLRSAGSLSADETLSILRQVLDALQAAHERGVVHRDLKPENILIAGDGAAKVTDFGLGKVQADVNLSLSIGSLSTLGGEPISGTLPYMSPEQQAGAEPDPRDDVYAVGIIACELLTGSRPAAAGVARALKRAGIGGGWAEVLEEACDDREYRYASASAMLDALTTLSKPRLGRPRPGETATNPADGAVMVWLPPGEFLMGADRSDNERVYEKFGWDKEWIEKYAKDEAPKHRVTVDGFWMYTHEVTVAQFQKFVDATGHKTTAEKEGKGRHYNAEKDEWVWVKGLSWRCPFEKGAAARPDHPVVQVSWDDAQAYCRWAGARLPTEAEWEYAARGGDTGLAGKPHHAFVWGSDAPTRPVANMWDESAARKWPKTNYLEFPKYDDGYALTAPVGAYAANGFGLFDMAGNVWEWCSDWYDEGYYANSPASNPTGSPDGKYRVARGGAWNSPPGLMRVSSRNWDAPDDRDSDSGFRCARTR